MKVTTLDKEIKAYVKLLLIERDGETYRADLTYDEYDGYELDFIDSNGRPTGTPDWAIEWEENNLESVASMLDNASGWWKFEKESE